jgi:hypothetical protein
VNDGERRSRRFEAFIDLPDATRLVAIHEGSVWSVTWNGRTWEGRSLVALVEDVPGNFGPGVDVLRQVLEALIEQMDRTAAQARNLHSYF